MPMGPPKDVFAAPADDPIPDGFWTFFVRILGRLSFGIGVLLVIRVLLEEDIGWVALLSALLFFRAGYRLIKARTAGSARKALWVFMMAFALSIVGAPHSGAL